MGPFSQSFIQNDKNKIKLTSSVFSLTLYSSLSYVQWRMHNPFSPPSYPPAALLAEVHRRPQCQASMFTRSSHVGESLSLSRSCFSHWIPKSAGLRWDRQWLVVNSKGRAYTQRVEPKLALVEIEMPNGAFDEGREPTVDSYMAPGMDPLKVPLVAEHAVADEVSVWEWSSPAHDEGVGAADWFSSYLGKPSLLVRFWTASEIRPVDVKYAQGHKVLFADGYPFLVASQGSLNALNEVLHEPININRFRPNILVDGCNPYSEDLWKEIKINNLTFNGVKLCARCKVPTINQENGIAGTKPTETMMKFRSDHVLRLACKQKGLVYFGQNMVWQDSLRRTMNGKLVKVGDPVYVVRKYASCDDVPA